MGHKTSKQRILSGMRPTGRLHLGNWLGALQNWVKLQDKYECYYMVADWHALTSDYARPGDIKSNTREMIIDWLSAGLDPGKSVLFVQSHVKEHAELHLLLSMITPLPWLERCPTYKEQMAEMSDKDLSTYGFLGYPLLQSADIMIYKANAVPVGKDQLPHLELCREIARRFNFMYNKQVFPEPESLLTDSPKTPGTDGRKMSKSYNNCIYLSDPPEEIIKKIKMMFTDPLKLRKGDPGHPKNCPVFSYHTIYSSAETHQISAECLKGSLGCTDCKAKLSPRLVKALEPIQAKRAELIKKKDEVSKVMADGAERARKTAVKTLEETREAIGI